MLAGFKRVLLGRPRDVLDPGVFHKVSLAAFLAWVGLGADGLSSSAYGPEEAFKALGPHGYLAVAMAGAIALTVFIISYAYSRIIEHFPFGGGGYVVATRLLGRTAGVVSGSALIVDYVLTIAISIAAGVDAVFSFLPPAWQGWKLAVAAAAIGVLTLLNLRGVKESVAILAPVFLTFVVGSWAVRAQFVLVTLASEACLLFVAAQAGFIDGPRVMANMSTDSWLPHRFAQLSDRLTMQNGVLLMSGAALLALWYTRGAVDRLVVMYSINVFLTFSLTERSMCRFWPQRRTQQHDWRAQMAINNAGLVLGATILTLTAYEKFAEGGWVTLVLTAGLIALCFAIRRHYRNVQANLQRLDAILPALPATKPGTAPSLDPRARTAVLLVGSYEGLGTHCLLSIQRLFPNVFQN